MTCHACHAMFQLCWCMALFCSYGTISGRIYVYIYIFMYLHTLQTAFLNEVPCLRDKTHEVKRNHCVLFAASTISSSTFYILNFLEDTELYSNPMHSRVAWNKGLSETWSKAPFNFWIPLSTNNFFLDRTWHKSCLSSVMPIEIACELSVSLNFLSIFACSGSAWVALSFFPLEGDLEPRTVFLLMQ